jgi:hypothetical protein
MKNIDKLKKHLIKVMIFVSFTFLVNSLVFSQMNSQRYVFCNKDTQKKGEDIAKDLHIQFDSIVRFLPLNSGNTTQAPENTFAHANGDSSTSVNFGTSSGPGAGAGVDSADCVALTLGHPGAYIPKVTKWWWTEDGELDSADILGDEHEVRDGRFSFASVPATGDGSLLLTLFDGDIRTFIMPAGVSGHDMAQLFAQFITDEVPWAEVSHIAAGDVIFFPTSFTGDTDFTVEIIPDSTLEVTFKYLPEVIPTLSEWGVIILLLLVLAVGMVFLYQRQPSLALAGAAVSQATATKPKIFDGKLFAKVFALVLLIGAVALVAAWLYFGQITSADPFGVFISAAVVAYMVQLHILRKARDNM